MLQFAAPLQEHFGDEYEMYTAVSGGSHPTLVLWREGDWKWFTVVHADPTCAKFTEEHIGTYLMTMVTFQGNIYYAGKDGQVFKFAAPAEPCDHELERCNHELVVVAQMAPDMDVEGRRMKGNSAASYLVESNGQLLLVRHLRNQFMVPGDTGYRVKNCFFAKFYSFLVCDTPKFKVKNCVHCTLIPGCIGSRSTPSP
jgi:hypothetical protein